jgi:hypothetical protein
MKITEARYIAMNLRELYKFHITGKEIKKYSDEYKEVLE